MSTDLYWQIERACHNAWPAAQTALFAHWVLKADGGTSRRINSVNPLRPDAGIDDAIVSDATRLYRTRGQDCVFRIPDLCRGADQALLRRGFGAEGETHTLYTTRITGAPSERLVLLPQPDERWFRERHDFARDDPGNDAVVRRLLQRVLVPAVFFRLEYRNETMAQAYAAIHDDFLVFEAVITRPDCRRRGFARELLQAALHRASELGASRACLQVEKRNTPALMLYQSLGFEHAYNYRYWRKAGTGHS